MHVAVDQAGHQHPAADIYVAINVMVDLAGWAYSSNLGTFDKDGLIGNERAALGIQDRRVFEDDSHAKS
jgi:hypothetical protein